MHFRLGCNPKSCKTDEIDWPFAGLHEKVPFLRRRLMVLADVQYNIAINSAGRIRLRCFVFLISKSEGRHFRSAASFLPLPVAEMLPCRAEQSRRYKIFYTAGLERGRFWLDIPLEK